MAQAGLQVPTYAYALNNPIGYVDRNGLDPVAGAAVGAEVGSFAGPAGAAIGAAVGAVAGTAAAAAVTATIVNAPPINWAGTEPGAGVPYPVDPVTVAPTAQPVSEPGCPTIPSTAPMAKGGKQNIRNHWYYLALQQPDPCAWLRAQYKSASSAVRLDIIKAQKALGCRASSGGGP